MKSLLWVSFLLLFSINEVFACSCQYWGDTIEEQFNSRVPGAVTVVKALPLESACLNYSDEGHAIRSACKAGAVQRTRFKSKKIWHRNFSLGHTFVVVNGVDQEKCGLVFEIDKEYVLYIIGDGGESTLRVNTCMGAKLLSKTSDKEIELLEKHSIDTEIERKKRCRKSFKNTPERLGKCLNYYENNLGQ